MWAVVTNMETSKTQMRRQSTGLAPEGFCGLRSEEFLAPMLSELVWVRGLLGMEEGETQKPSFQRHL